MTRLSHTLIDEAIDRAGAMDEEGLGVGEQHPFTAIGDAMRAVVAEARQGVTTS